MNFTDRTSTESGKHIPVGDPLAVTVALEQRVWDALIARDADGDRELLHRRFIGVYPSGYATADEHAAMDPSTNNGFLSYQISETRLIEITSRARMLIYRADYRSAPTNQVMSMYVSSLWVHEAGNWTNLFSQDTPLRSDH